MQYISCAKESETFNELERLVLTTDLATNALNSCVLILQNRAIYVSRPMRNICANAIVVRLRLALESDKEKADKMIQQLKEPIFPDDWHMDVKFRRELASKLEQLKAHLLKIREDPPDYLKPATSFLHFSGKIDPFLVKMLHGCQVATWTICPSKDRQSFRLEVTGVSPIEEFEKLKTDWLTANDMELNELPEITYIKTEGWNKIQINGF